MPSGEAYCLSEVGKLKLFPLIYCHLKLLTVMNNDNKPHTVSNFLNIRQQETTLVICSDLVCI